MGKKGNSQGNDCGELDRELEKTLCGSYNVPTNVRNLQNGISKVQRTCTLQTLTHNGTRPLKLDN